MTAYFQSGGLVDAVLNLGLPAPIDVQVSGSNMEPITVASTDRRPDSADSRGQRSAIPQDLDFPLFNSILTDRAGQIGLSQREVISNVITALTSNQMIAPSYWVDPKSGNDYMLTVQYPEAR